MLDENLDENLSDSTIYEEDDSFLKFPEQINSFIVNPKDLTTFKEENLLKENSLKNKLNLENSSSIQDYWKSFQKILFEDSKFVEIQNKVIYYLFKIFNLKV